MLAHPIPVVDLSVCPDLTTQKAARNYDYGTLDMPASVVHAVHAALKSGDFMQLAGTGIIKHVPELRNDALSLFSHPREVLDAWQHADRMNQRGYSPPGGEKAVGAKEADKYRQFWMTGNLAEKGDGDEEDRRFDTIDIDPDELSRNSATGRRRLMALSLHAARLVLRCVEDINGFNAGYLVDMTLGADTTTRTLFYDTSVPNSTLAAAHWDINAVTVLAGDMYGLRVRIDGVWYVVRVRKDCALMNLGELFNLVTGLEHQGRIEHEVRALPGVANPRIQDATFVHWRRNVQLVGGRCGDLFDGRIAEIHSG